MTKIFGLHDDLRYLEPNLAAFLDGDREYVWGSLYLPHRVFHPGGQYLLGATSVNTSGAAMHGRIANKDAFYRYGGYSANPVVNYALNPAAYGAGNIAALGAATVLIRSMEKAYFKEATSAKLTTTAAANDGISYTLSALVNEINEAIVYIDTVWATQEWSLDGINWHAPTLNGTDHNWKVYYYRFPAVEANGSALLRIRQTDATARTVYIGAVYVHRYVTNYADVEYPFHGGMGTPGFAWSGAAHASTSQATCGSMITTATNINNVPLNSYDFTYLCWLAFPNAKAGYPLHASVHNVMSVRAYYSGTWSNYNLTLSIVSTGGLSFYFAHSGGGDTVNANNNWAAYQWVFAAGVVDYTNRRLRIYSGLDNGTWDTPVSAAITGNLLEQVVHIWFGDGAPMFGYAVDDFALFNKALTTEEIRAIFDLTYPGVSLGLYEHEKHVCGSDIWRPSS